MDKIEKNNLVQAGYGEKKYLGIQIINKQWGN
jgi:hypothetical protein